MSKRAGFLAAVFAALSLGQAEAASYYVSAAGSDSNDGLSPSKPLRSPARAVSALSDGDSIFFRAGDHFVLSDALVIKRSGSAKEPIVIGAYEVKDGEVSHRVTSNRPILDGDKKAPKLGTYAGLVHVTGRHVEIRDLVVRNSGGLGVRFIETSNGRVENVQTDWSYYFGIQAYKSDNIEIEDCDVKGFGQGGKYYGESAFPNGISIRSTSNARVAGCLVREGWGEGINTFYGSRNVVIENNTLYAIRNVGIYIDSTQNVDVRNNIVLGTADTLYHRYSNRAWTGPGIALNNESYQFDGGLSTSAVAKNVRIYNNLVAGTVTGLAFWGQHLATNWQDILIANNTFVDNETQIQVTANRFTKTQIINNIFLSLSSGTSDWKGSLGQSGIEWRNNYWSGGKPSGGSSPGDVYQGLVLQKMSGWLGIRSHTDVSWRDFMPVADSKTVKAGTDTVLSLVSADFRGKVRPSPPDLGGLESGDDAPAERRPKAPGAMKSRLVNPAL